MKHGVWDNRTLTVLIAVVSVSSSTVTISKEANENVSEDVKLSSNRSVLDRITSWDCQWF